MLSTMILLPCKCLLNVWCNLLRCYFVVVGFSVISVVMFPLFNSVTSSCKEILSLFVFKFMICTRYTMENVGMLLRKKLFFYIQDIDIIFNIAVVFVFSYFSIRMLSISICFCIAWNYVFIMSVPVLLVLITCMRTVRFDMWYAD